VREIEDKLEDEEAKNERLEGKIRLLKQVAPSSQRQSTFRTSSFWTYIKWHTDAKATADRSRKMPKIIAICILLVSSPHEIPIKHIADA
jgi:hypothetical protein